MIDALLSEAGLRTGRYTSPHLHRATERITWTAARSRGALRSRCTGEIQARTSSWWTTAARQAAALSKFEVLTAWRTPIRRRPGRGRRDRDRAGRQLGRTNVADAPSR